MRQVETLAELERLKADWDDVSADCATATPFDLHEWAVQVARCYFPAARLRVLIAYECDLPIAIAPLVLSQRRTFGRILVKAEFLNDVESDINDVIVRNGYESRLPELLAELLARCADCDEIVLDKVDANGPLAAAIRSLPGALVSAKYLTHAPLLRLLDESGHRIDVSRLPRAKRLKGYLNALKRIGVWQYEICRTDEEIRRGVDAVTSLHRLRWNPTSTPSSFRSPTRREFLFNISRQMNELGLLHLVVMSVDNVPVAAVHGFVHRGTYYYRIPVVNPAYAKHSPGRVLLLELIREMSGHVEEFNFLMGDEPYKYEYATGHRTLQRILVHRSRLRHAATRLLDQAEDLANRSERTRACASRVKHTALRARIYVRQTVAHCRSVYQLHGPVGLFVKAASTLGQRLFERVDQHIYSRNRVDSDVPADLVRATDADVDAIRAFHPGGVRQFEQDLLERQARGDVLLVRRERDEPAFWLWKGSAPTYALTDLGPNRRVVLAENDVAVYDVYTRPESRRRGYYVQALRDLCNGPAGRCLIWVRGDNVASRRAIEKAGFTRLVTIQRRRFLRWERVTIDGDANAVQLSVS